MMRLSVFKPGCIYIAKLLSRARYFFLHLKLHKIDPKPFHLNFCNVSLSNNFTYIFTHDNASLKL